MLAARCCHARVQLPLLAALTVAPARRPPVLHNSLRITAVLGQDHLPHRLAVGVKPADTRKSGAAAAAFSACPWPPTCRVRAFNRAESTSGQAKSGLEQSREQIWLWSSQTCSPRGDQRGSWVWAVAPTRSLKEGEFPVSLPPCTPALPCQHTDTQDSWCSFCAALRDSWCVWSGVSICSLLDRRRGSLRLTATLHASFALSAH